VASNVCQAIARSVIDTHFEHSFVGVNSILAWREQLPDPTTAIADGAIDTMNETSDPSAPQV
jgi:hypothetical protein